MIVLAETSKQKGGYMNSITNLLDLEDTDIEITDIQIQGQTKILTLSTPPVPHFCPSCGFRMYSRGIKKRTINHPILQDNYSLPLKFKNFSICHLLQIIYQHILNFSKRLISYHPSLNNRLIHINTISHFRS